MERPWEAEEAIDLDRAARLLAARFPELAGARVEPFGEGWDNSAFLVDDAWVFRFPRRKLAVALMEAELRCLPRAAAVLPAPIPVPHFVGAPGGDFAWPFAGYALIDGTTACRAALDDDRRTALVEPLAEFLRALHAIDADRAREWGAPPDTFRRLELPHRSEQASAKLREVSSLGLVERDRADALAAVVAATPLDWTPRTRSLCHGDLYARHVLVDAAGGLAGVIDWGDLHVGDGTVDLALARGFLPPEAQTAFRGAYGEVSDRAWAVAGTRALVTNLSVVLYAHDVGDSCLEAEGHRALSNLAAS